MAGSEASHDENMWGRRVLVTNEPLTACPRNNSFPPVMTMLLKRKTTTTAKPCGVLVRAR